MKAAAAGKRSNDQAPARPNGRNDLPHIRARVLIFRAHGNQWSAMTSTQAKGSRKAPPAKRPGADFQNPAVAAAFDACPAPVRTKLLALRRLIFDTARTTEGVGVLEEALKWGQVSYLTSQSKSGSTIRIDRVKSGAGQYAVYFHCQTDLVATFRELYPELSYGGNRSILLDAADQFPKTALRHCVALALTYHLNKRKAARAR
jgi:hypothetical protein